MKKSIQQATIAAVIITTLYILLTSVLLDEIFRESIFYLNIAGIYPYFLILSLVLIILATLMLYRAIKFGHSSLYVLVLVVFLSGLSYFFGFLNFDPTGTVNFRQTRYFQLQVLAQTISVYLLFLHFELNTKDQPKSKILFLFTLLFTPYTFLNLYYLVMDNYSSSPVVEALELVSLVLLQVGVFLVFIWVLNVSTTNFEIIENRGSRSRLLAQSQLVGLVILLLGIIFQTVETVTSFDVWHTPLNTLAIFFIAIAYYMDPKALLLAPINVLLFGIIDEDGRTMYYNPIDPEFDETGDSSQLFGGLTVAFTSFGKEIAKTEAHISTLKFGDRSVIVEYKSPFYIVVIANQSTYFLQQEMLEYLDELVELYPKVPKDGSLLPEDDINALNHKFFPIL